MTRDRDNHAGAHRDRRRLHLRKLGEKEQREAMEQFKKTNLMTQKLTFADSSAIKADIAKLAVRVTVLEAELSSLDHSASPRSQPNLISGLAFVLALGLTALEALRWWHS